MSERGIYGSVRCSVWRVGFLLSREAPHEIWLIGRRRVHLPSRRAAAGSRDTLRSLDRQLTRRLRATIVVDEQMELNPERIIREASNIVQQIVACGTADGDDVATETWLGAGWATFIFQGGLFESAARGTGSESGRTLGAALPPGGESS